MKTLRKIAVILALLLTTLTVSAQQRLFGEFADYKGVTTVYISPAAMRMGLNMEGGDSSSLGQVKDAIKQPQGMEVVTAENPEAAEVVRTAARKIIKKLGMELFLNTKNGEENVNIYAGKVISDSVMKDILIEVSEGSEYTLVYIKGEVDTNSLSKP